MNKKLLATFIVTVITGQLFAMTFLINWNGDSIGNRLDSMIARIIL